MFYCEYRKVTYKQTNSQYSFQLNSIMIDFHKSIDETDFAIIELLQKDGHMSNSSMAEKIGVSEGTIRNKIKRMTALKLLRITAQFNLYEDDSFIAFYILIRSSSRNLTSIAERVSKFPGVMSVSTLAGQYDIIAEVLLDSKASYVGFIEKYLGTLPEIIMTESLLISKSFNKWATTVQDVMVLGRD